MKKAEFRKNYGQAGSWAFWDPDDVRDLTVIGRYWKRRKPHYVLVGLNVSEAIEYTWSNFHRSGNDAKLGYAIARTKYRGAYMTDVIKHKVQSNSKEVQEDLKEPQKSRHVKRFEEELRALGCRNKLIIALGNGAFDILSEYLAPGYRIKKALHYSARRDPSYRNKHAYAKKLKADLKKAPFITGTETVVAKGG